MSLKIKSTALMLALAFVLLCLASCGANADEAFGRAW